jgi:hypothetical protein
MISLCSPPPCFRYSWPDVYIGVHDIGTRTSGRQRPSQYLPEAVSAYLIHADLDTAQFEPFHRFTALCFLAILHRRLEHDWLTTTEIYLNLTSYAKWVGHDGGPESGSTPLRPACLCRSLTGNIHT